MKWPYADLMTSLQPLLDSKSTDLLTLLSMSHIGQSYERATERSPQPGRNGSRYAHGTSMCTYERRRAHLQQSVTAEKGRRRGGKGVEGRCRLAGAQGISK